MAVKGTKFNLLRRWTPELLNITLDKFANWPANPNGGLKLRKEIIEIFNLEVFEGEVETVALLPNDEEIYATYTVTNDPDPDKTGTYILSEQKVWELTNTTFSRLKLEIMHVSITTGAITDFVKNVNNAQYLDLMDRTIVTQAMWDYAEEGIFWQMFHIYENGKEESDDDVSLEGSVQASIPANTKSLIWEGIHSMAIDNWDLSLIEELELDFETGEFIQVLVKGEKGDTGATGATGAPGKDGTNGIDGADGRDGSNGSDGQSFNFKGEVPSFADLLNIVGNLDDAYTVLVDETHANKEDVLYIFNGNQWVFGGSIQGTPGVDGKDGANGRDGTNGVDGLPGKDGADGAPGKDGADGLPGKDGAPGKDGVDGKDSLIPGTSGKTGATGPAGKDGADGADGKDGTNGHDGQSFKFKGEVNTHADLAKIVAPAEDDAYIVLIDETHANKADVLYIYNGAAWVYGGSIQGPQGKQGFQGVPGRNGTDGKDGADGVGDSSWKDIKVKTTAGIKTLGTLDPNDVLLNETEIAVAIKAAIDKFDTDVVAPVRDQANIIGENTVEDENGAKTQFDDDSKGKHNVYTAGAVDKKLSEKINETTADNKYALKSQIPTGNIITETTIRNFATSLEANIDVNLPGWIPKRFIGGKLTQSQSAQEASTRVQDNRLDFLYRGNQESYLTMSQTTVTYHGKFGAFSSYYVSVEYERQTMGVA